ncbi:hypothetical protein CspeluHIS016_0401470 [Cutaneotrichosporon spelunceum]|uniref:Sister chromatid cohesion protein DCC1 n=1 Tax=Cutaneotrichosporon spelunceum TaxID=1672016 RepID=A0AAD3TUU6_9TREE|nr:hypothetical protein CspeluHIS016_0401470 [Cutaneotrichosporon spelunceum]
MVLPNKRVTVRFAPVIQDEVYQLLELPPDIFKAVEGGQTASLTIKGRPSDDAVLCTSDKTYALRGVSISNSLLVLRPPPSSTGELLIRDIRHEVLECVPAAGRTERLYTLLRDSAWRGVGHPPWPERVGDKRKRMKRYTRAQLSSVVQASEAELERALRDANIVEVQGYMLLLRPPELSSLLSLLLALLTVHSTEAEGDTPTAPAEAIMAALAGDHDVQSDLSRSVMDLFGSLVGDEWTADVSAVVRELGRGLLAAQGTVPQPLNVLLSQWTSAAGAFEAHVALDLLAGSYLLRDPPPAASVREQLVEYFPVHTLSANVPTRFADLFLTRARWRPDDMIPFLRGLYPEGDSKARDKLVAKHIRVVKEREGAWWYPRRTG